MRQYSVNVTFQAVDDEMAEQVRSEVAESLQDACDCGELPNLDFSVDPAWPTILPPNPDEEFYRTKAADTRHKDGDIEFDDNAAVSLGDDNGAYVQAWVWIDGPDSEGGNCD